MFTIHPYSTMQNQTRTFWHLAVGLKIIGRRGLIFKIENAFFTIDLFIYNGSKSQLSSVPVRHDRPYEHQFKSFYQKSTQNNKKLIVTKIERPNKRSKRIVSKQKRFNIFQARYLLKNFQQFFGKI